MRTDNNKSVLRPLFHNGLVNASQLVIAIKIQSVGYQTWFISHAIIL